MGTESILLKQSHLRQACAALELEGFEVETPPPDLLEQGVILTAYHHDREEGFLLSPEEVRLVAIHGLAALDPEPTDPRPRWQRSSTRNREQAYAEAALARAVLEVQSAPRGNRNNTLAKVAFGLGQLEHLGLDESRVVQALFDAALATGLEHREALSTARRGFKKGTEHPRDLPPDLVQSAKGCANPFALNKSDKDGHSRFSAAKHQSVFARKGGKR
jgi:hypothetical protein